MNKSKLIKLSLITLKENLVNIPIMICDVNNKILYKNKMAYFCGFPRLGSMVDPHLSDEDRLNLNDLSKDRTDCFFADLITVRGTKTGAVIRNTDDNSTVWLFPQGLELIKDKDFLKEMYTSVRSIYGQIYPFILQNDSRFCAKHELLKRKCSVLFLDPVPRTGEKPMSVDNLCYVINRYMKQLLRCLCIPLSKFKLFVDYYDAETVCIMDPESFITSFLTMLTMFFLKDCGGIDVKAIRVDANLVAEARIITPIRLSEKSYYLQSIAEQMPASAIETVFFDEIVRRYNWTFEMFPAGKKEIVVRLGTKAFKLTSPISSGFTDKNRSRAFARFLEFIRK